MENIKDDSIDVAKAINFAKQMEKSDAKSVAQKRTYEAKAQDPHKSAKQSKGSKMVVKSAKDAGDLDHGSLVKDSKGVGIVVENDHGLRKIAENDEMLQLMQKLTDPNDPTFDNMQFKVNRPEGTEFPIEEYIRKNPYSDEALKLKEVRKAFAGWELSAMNPMTGAVLAPTGSPQAIAYKEAMDAIRSGKVRLPTVAEYEEQKRRAEEALKRGELPVNQPQPRPAPKLEQKTEQPVVQEQKPIEQPEEIQEEESELEENLDVLSMRLKMNEEALKMNSSERNALTNSATVDPMVAAAATPVNAPLANNKGVTVSAKLPKNDVPANVIDSDPMVAAAASHVPAPEVPATQSAPQVIDIGGAEVAAAISSNQPSTPSTPTDDVSNMVVVEVPASKADTFMKNLPKDIEKKVQTAEKVKIQFVGEVTLPNAVNRISTLRQYRRVAPKNVGEGVTSSVLMNSGFIAYVSPVGSLEWALISPVRDEEGGVEYPDVGKIAQFCYSHLINTSIGPMSYVEFCEHTAFDDLGQILFSLMRASQPDEQSISLICQKQTCQNEYPTKYKISELPDYFRMKQDARDQISLIVSVKDVIDDAKEVHEQSPVMRKLVYSAKSSGSIFVLKNFDIATIVDRMPVLETIKEEYGDAIAILVQFTNEVYVKVDDTGDESKDYNITNDPTVIAEEYMRLQPSEIKEIQGPLEAIPRFDPIRFSMKGRHVCTSCGAAVENIPQDIQDLVFHLALVARYYG